MSNLYLVYRKWFIINIILMDSEGQVIPQQWHKKWIVTCCCHFQLNDCFPSL